MSRRNELSGSDIAGDIFGIVGNAQLRQDVGVADHLCGQNQRFVEMVLALAGGLPCDVRGLHVHVGSRGDEKDREDCIRYLQQQKVLVHVG